MTSLLVFFKGILIGIANIIPGVSGGTFALLLGIYDRLLAAIGAFGVRTLKSTWRVVVRPTRKEHRDAFIGEWRHLDGTWLFTLALGAGAAILASSRLIAYLLDKQLAPTLAFFVGLILPSISVPLALMQRRGWREICSLLAATTCMVGISVVQPVAGSNFGLPGLFVAGTIAIAAMILPGISGSFVLMVLGQYRSVLDAINNWDFLSLGVFAAGCVVGLIAFVRLLNFLLRRFQSTTMAFLIGLILGSLWILWPFKLVEDGARISTAPNVWPESWDTGVWWAMSAFVLGLVSAIAVSKVGKKWCEKPAGLPP